MKTKTFLALVGVVALMAASAACEGNVRSPTGPGLTSEGNENATGLNAPMVASTPRRTVHLPITAFTARQGNVIYHWWDPSTDKWLSFDHYGVRGAALGLDLPTSIDGDVAIRTLNDGRAQVSVTLHTRNALCFGWQGDDLAFGYAGGEVRAGIGPASLGDGLFREVFTMPSPDTPLPTPADWSSGDFTDRRLSVVIKCEGVLRAASGFAEGTPGFARTVQQALLAAGAPGHCPAGDCWPVETVFFKPVGGQ